MINLDPAVEFIPYECNLDIRSFLNYQEIMMKYKLGPNGAMLTCLNLLCTQINLLLDKVKEEIENKRKIFLVDTPGQIEIFNWSASG